MRRTMSVLNFFFSSSPSSTHWERGEGRAYAPGFGLAGHLWTGLAFLRVGRECTAARLTVVQRSGEPPPIVLWLRSAASSRLLRGVDASEFIQDSNTTT